MGHNIFNDNSNRSHVPGSRVVKSILSPSSDHVNSDSHNNKIEVPYKIMINTRDSTQSLE